MQTTSTTSSGGSEGGEYTELVQILRDAKGWPLLTTDATAIYNVFLHGLPARRRQHYTCRACRKFVERFGGLVTINPDGSARSLLWARDVPEFFQGAVDNVNELIAVANVTGVFLNSEPIWGLAQNRSGKSADGWWHHLHLIPQGSMRNRENVLLNSEQMMAEKLQDFGTLGRALEEFNIDVIRKAHTLLTSGSLYRSEKCIGVAKWLLDLHEVLALTKHNRRRDNLVWRAVATAPPGYVHVRSTMIGALLTDLLADKPFDEIKAAFDAKLNPLQYQRPQAAPTDGQLAAAEAVVLKLASAGSLRRRYATLEEVLPHAIWTPKALAESSDGSVFGHLKTSQKKAAMDLPAQVMTWDKFSWTVLPEAERIEFSVSHVPMPLFAYVTAADPNAPPILQWDSETIRNPISWYLYHHGSRADWFNLTAGAFVDVMAITPQASSWRDSHAHQGDGAYFILKGARDLHGVRAGLGLFPEILRAEYRGIRAAMEAFSRSRSIEGLEASTACGLALQKSSGAWESSTFRVTSKGTRVLYKLDRWD
jgi:hypothetical protein